MRRSLVFLVAGFLGAMFAPIGVTHDMPYSMGQGRVGLNAFVDCGIGNHVVLNLSFGGICFGATANTGWGNGNEGFTDELGNPAGSALPQHLTPNAQGEASIGNLFSLVFGGMIPGVYCQDLNEDTLCGGNLSGPAETEPGGNPSAMCQAPHTEGVGLCALRSEPFVEFCGGLTIRSGLLGPRAAPNRLPGGSATGTPVPYDGTWAAATSNWAIDFDVLILVSNPTNGFQIAGQSAQACGAQGDLESLRWGDPLGFVVHG